MDGTHMFLPKSSCQRSLWTTPRQISSLALLLLFEAYFLRYFHLWWYWQKVESFTCIMLDKTKRLFIFGMWFFFTLMYNLTRALFLLSNGNIRLYHNLPLVQKYGVCSMISVAFWRDAKKKKNSNVIHPKYYKHLKKAAESSIQFVMYFHPPTLDLK